jgi:Tfp pilus assembly protein PilZ
MSTNAKARRYPRMLLPKGMFVAWEHSGVRKVSRVGVLAVGGLFITTPDPPPAGDTIMMIFEIPGCEVRARARVCDSQFQKGMGVEFTVMDQEARARLTQLMNLLTRDVRK